MAGADHIFCDPNQTFRDRTSAAAITNSNTIIARGRAEASDNWNCWTHGFCPQLLTAATLSANPHWLHRHCGWLVWPDSDELSILGSSCKQEYY